MTVKIKRLRWDAMNVRLNCNDTDFRQNICTYICGAVRTGRCVRSCGKFWTKRPENNWRWRHASRRKRRNQSEIVSKLQLKCTIYYFIIALSMHQFMVSRWKGNDQEPTRSNSTFCPRYQARKEHRQLRRHKRKVSRTGLSQQMASHQAILNKMNKIQRQIESERKTQIQLYRINQNKNSALER